MNSFLFGIGLESTYLNKNNTKRGIIHKLISKNQFIIIVVFAFLIITISSYLS